MFNLEDLAEHFGETMLIGGVTFTLEKVEELSGVHALWISESYKVYATPCFDGVDVPVHVIDCNNQEVGTDGYPIEIDSFECYVKVVQTLSAKILRRPQM